MAFKKQSIYLKERPRPFLSCYFLYLEFLFVRFKMIKNSKHIFRGLQYGALALPYYRRDAINTRSPAWRFLQLETYFPLCIQ